MTRPTSRRLLALALATALSMPAWAQTAFAPFTVSDIRIDGLQRIGAGTVFTYLPVERGDTLDQAKAAEALRALYKTGFFEDVRLDRQGSILVITVVERPAINKLTLVGNKDLKTEDLLKGLKDIGLAEGETFNRSTWTGSPRNSTASTTTAASTTSRSAPTWRSSIATAST
jgi:outer membrane protein insertion porin family